MHFRRVLPSIVCACLAGCASLRRGDVETCAKFATGQWAPYDSTMVASLPGRYDLIVISESPDDFNKSARGPLELRAAGSNDGVLERAPVWGWATLSGQIQLPDQSAVASSDPARPGLVVEPDGDVPLGAAALPAGSTSSGARLHIERVGRDGFSGTWTRDNLSRRDSLGLLQPQSGGRFCALRR